MGIRILLLSLLAAIGYFAFLRRRTFPVHIVVIFAILGMTGLLVVFPDVTTIVASKIGVGRGVDLITYLVEIGMLFMILHFYSKNVELEKQLTTLTRELALLRTELTELRGGAPTRERSA